MQVFKGFFKVLKAHKTGVLIYIGIIVLMAVLLGTTGASDDNTFAQEKYDILVVDEDKTEISKYLTEYLAAVHNVKDESFAEDQTKDMIYYRAVVARITIPKGFSDAFAEGDAKVSIMCDTGIPGGIYLDNQINAYLSNLKRYMKLEPGLDRAHEKALSAADYASVVEIADGGDKASGIPFSIILFMGFGLLGIILSGLLPVLFIFRKPGISERNSVSAYPSVKRSFELSISTVVFSLVVYAVMGAVMVVATISDHDAEQIALYLVNLLVFTVVTALIASMIANLPIKGTEEQIGMITNVVSLSLSFLGGVFVPLEVMGENVKAVSRFLPTYWYSTAVNAITDGKGFADIAGYMGIELLFGIACLAVGIVFARRADA